MMMMFRKKKLLNELMEKRKTNRLNRPQTPTDTVFISNYLDSSRVCFFKEGISYDQALSTLIQQIPGQNSESLESLIREREKMGSTAVTSDIAFPHARIQGLDQIVSVIGISPSGVKMPCSATVRVIFLFISPTENTRTHLRFLAGASSLFLGENFLETLLSLNTPEAVLQIIHESERKSKQESSEALSRHA